MNGLQRGFERIPWIVWPALIGVLWSWSRRFWMRQSGQRKAQAAQDWPPADGVVQSINVVNPSRNSQEGYCATFTYSYSVQQGGDLEYLSADHERFFQDEGAAWDWLRSMKDKRIRIRVKPGKPKVSAVLDADLDVGCLASASGPAGTLTLPGTASKTPQEFRGPTEMAAWLASAGFCLSIADHLSRVLRHKPLYPQLSIALWIGFLVAAVPFGLWYKSKAGESIFGKPRAWSKVPVWLRVSTYALNLYVGSFWLIDMVLSSGVVHTAWKSHYMDPMSNGVFLALLYGDAAAILYARLEDFEDPYSLTAAGLHPR